MKYTSFIVFFTGTKLKFIQYPHFSYVQLTIIYIFISLIFLSTLFALRFDNINSAACIVADLHAILFEPNGNISEVSLETSI